MNALIIGYGSIGKRHEEVLNSLDVIRTIHIVSKQKLPEKTSFSSIDVIPNLNKYDYFVIASETFKHLEQLRYLEKHVSKKLIFCEKPLFDSHIVTSFKQNQVYVGYVLRYHPLLEKLFNDIQGQVIISANIVSGSYLPQWRKVDYRKTYSASKSLGGGVLLDLSHEIDYIQWLFGCFEQLFSLQTKVSDLEIDSDDLVVAFGKTAKGVIVNFSLDYFSKIPIRKINVHTLNETIIVDLVKNTFLSQSKEGDLNEYELGSLERNLMFENMHKAILGDKKYSCTFDEGMTTMNAIKEIQENNV